jgi:hypothetical protein
VKNFGAEARREQHAHAAAKAERWVTVVLVALVVLVPVLLAVYFHFHVAAPPPRTDFLIGPGKMYAGPPGPLDALTGADVSLVVGSALFALAAPVRALLGLRPQHRERLRRRECPPPASGL